MSQRSGRARVGIRELRQNLSIYVDRVKEGESLEVTEHGHPVAQLGPLPAGRLTRYDQLVADGRITPATRALADGPAPIQLPAQTEPLSSTLQRLRDEETA